LLVFRPGNSVLANELALIISRCAPALSARELREMATILVAQQYGLRRKDTYARLAVWNKARRAAQRTAEQ